MGMFDWLDCKYPLPDGHVSKDHEFQTKDTPLQFLEVYTITAAGRLVADECHYEEVTKEFWERVEKDAKASDDLRGRVRRVVDSADVDQNFHGALVFYGDSETDGFWRTYRARFTDGALVRIELVEKEPYKRSAG